MKNSWLHKAVAVLTLAVIALAIGCFDPDVTGKYRDTEGAVQVELKGGKATLDLGQLRIDAKYVQDGDKVTITPEGGPSRDVIVLTVDKDGALVANPPNPLFSKLVKIK
jgi:hypothetical protein